MVAYTYRNEARYVNLCLGIVALSAHHHRSIGSWLLSKRIEQQDFASCR